MLLTFKARVKLISEDEMEIDNEGMNIKFEGKWVWRMVSIPYSDIFRIVQYSKDKTLIYLYGFEESPEFLLVWEDFQSVNMKWKACKTAELCEDSSTDKTLDEDISEENDEE